MNMPIQAYSDGQLTTSRVPVAYVKNPTAQPRPISHLLRSENGWRALYNKTVEKIMMANIVTTIITNAPTPFIREINKLNGAVIDRVVIADSHTVVIDSLRTPPAELLKKYNIDGTFFDGGDVAGFVNKGTCTLAKNDEDWHCVKQAHGY